MAKFNDPKERLIYAAKTGLHRTVANMFGTQDQHQGLDSKSIDEALQQATKAGLSAHTKGDIEKAGKYWKIVESIFSLKTPPKASDPVLEEILSTLDKNKQTELAKKIRALGSHQEPTSVRPLSPAEAVQNRLINAARKGLPQTVAYLCKIPEYLKALDLKTSDKALKEAIQAGSKAQSREQVSKYEPSLKTLCALRLRQIKLVADSYDEVKAVDLPATSLDKLLRELTDSGIAEAKKGNQMAASQYWEAIQVLCSLTLKGYRPSDSVIDEALVKLAKNQQSKVLRSLIDPLGQERVLNGALSAYAKEELAWFLEESAWSKPLDQEKVDEEFADYAIAGKWYDAFTVYFKRMPSPSQQAHDFAIKQAFERKEWDIVEFLLQINEPTAVSIVDELLRQAVKDDQLTIVEQIFSFKTLPSLKAFEEALASAKHAKKTEITNLLKAAKAGDFPLETHVEAKPIFKVNSQNDFDRALKCSAYLRDWSSVASLLEQQKPSQEVANAVLILALEEKKFDIIEQLILMDDSNSLAIPDKENANALFYRWVENGELDYIKKLFLNTTNQPTQKALNLALESVPKTSEMGKYLVLQKRFSSNKDPLQGVRSVIEHYVRFNQHLYGVVPDFERLVHAVKQFEQLEKAEDRQALMAIMGEFVEVLKGFKDLRDYKDKEFERYLNFIQEKVTGKLVTPRDDRILVLEEEHKEKGTEVDSELREPGIPPSEIYFRKLPKASEMAQLAYHDKLTEAARNKKWSQVETLLNSSQQPNSLVANKVLHLAVKAGQLNIIKQLFGLDIPNQPTELKIAIRAAKKANQGEIAKYLTDQDILISKATNPLQATRLILENYVNKHKREAFVSHFFDSPVSRVRELINEIKRIEDSATPEEKNAHALKILDELRDIPDISRNQNLVSRIDFIEEQIISLQDKKAISPSNPF
ncbi:Ankyrin repeats (3 copies) [Legionella lansingensis]|uniref:Ankyrin repeats (3 copies) n=1 Tax=Legionella lansingensis TaxID=45067 RepID=A0A0W0VLG8_9GAMM|nr:hypothetical protein [Legionella lansingensis]KTD20976.1 Ankyrin repeats (3 copies) [Legionella lansingensis]SNV44681.1 Ankyrin repeats (3 copies) [Legionella lansingensis]